MFPHRIRTVAHLLLWECVCQKTNFLPLKSALSWVSLRWAADDLMWINPIKAAWCKRHLTSHHVTLLTTLRVQHWKQVTLQLQTQGAGLTMSPRLGEGEGGGHPAPLCTSSSSLSNLMSEAFVRLSEASSACFMEPRWDSGRDWIWLTGAAEALKRICGGKCHAHVTVKSNRKQKHREVHYTQRKLKTLQSTASFGETSASSSV